MYRINILNVTVGKIHFELASISYDYDVFIKLSDCFKIIHVKKSLLSSLLLKIKSNNGSGNFIGL